jgi:hypothetical protein
MGDEQKTANYSFGCKLGEAVFTDVFIECIKTNSDAQNFVDEINAAIKPAWEARDERLVALISELLIENAIEKYLSAFSTGYNELMDKKDFTFSLKIATAKALRLSPPQIFYCADVIRKVRNEFAHNIEVKRFCNLKPELLAQINEAYRIMAGNPKKVQNAVQAFQILTVLLVTTLSMYTRQITKLSSFLRKEDFMDWFEKNLVIQDNSASTLKNLHGEKSGAAP